jgi:hypothetical protein
VTVTFFMPANRCDDDPVARPRQHSCHAGHRFTEANTRLNGNGSQECLACHRRRSRDWQRQHPDNQESLDNDPAVDDKQPHPIALVVWAPPGLQASWTYHATRDAAAALAPRDGTPFSIVDITRKPWIQHPPIGKTA